MEPQHVCHDCGQVFADFHSLDGHFQREHAAERAAWREARAALEADERLRDWSYPEVGSERRAASERLRLYGEYRLTERQRRVAQLVVECRPPSKTPSQQSLASELVLSQPSVSRELARINQIGRQVRARRAAAARRRTESPLRVMHRKRTTSPETGKRHKGRVWRRFDSYDPIIGESIPVYVTPDTDITPEDGSAEPLPEYRRLKLYRVSEMRIRWNDRAQIQSELRGIPFSNALKTISRDRRFCPWCGTPILVGERLETSGLVRARRRFCDEACAKAFRRSNKRTRA